MFNNDFGNVLVVFMEMILILTAAIVCAMFSVIVFGNDLGNNVGNKFCYNLDDKKLT